MSSVKTGLYVPPAFRPCTSTLHPSKTANLPPKPSITSTDLPPRRSRSHNLFSTLHALPALGKVSGEVTISALHISQLSNLGAAYGVLGEPETLGSYKWVASEDGKPTIAVPGVPDIWLGKEDVGKVTKDSELKGNIEFPDYTSSHVPKGISQHEPLFLSLADPARKLQKSSLITSRNNLRKIFMFLLPHLSHIPYHSSDPKHSSFRINAHLIPQTSTILIDRTDDNISKSHQPKDWHLAYHEATTARIFKGSDRTPGCIRVVKYDWAGLGVVVRFDVDAFIPDEEDEVLLEEEGDGSRAGAEAEGESVWDELSQLVSENGLDELVSIISESEYSVDTTLAESGSTISGMPTSLSETTIIPTQSGINIMRHLYTSPPHENLIAIKVRNIGRFNPVTNVKGMNRAHDVYAQLLIARLPTMYLAHHRNGEFVPGVEKVKTDGEEWEDVRKDVEYTLRGVRSVLAWMVDLTKKYGDGVGFIGSGSRIEAVRLPKGSVLGLSDEALSRLGSKRSANDKTGGKDVEDILSDFNRISVNE